MGYFREFKLITITKRLEDRFESFNVCLRKYIEINIFLSDNILSLVVPF